MQLFNLYHNNQFYRLFNSDFWLFELSLWLHVLARSLVTVFVPILMLITGYGIGDVILYYVLYNAIDVPFNFFARWLVRKIGARWVIAVGTFFAIAFFLTLAFLVPNSWGMLALLALFAALYDTLYWVAHIFFFIESNKGAQDTGKNTGILYSVKRLASLIGPAVGAGILLLFNDTALIYTSVVIFFLSLIPLIWVDEFPDKPEKKQVSFKKFFSHWREKKNYLLTSLFSIHGAAEGVIWPLFIYVAFESIGSVALVPIIISITTILFSYLAGKIKRRSRDKAIIIGALLIAAVWVLRLTIEIPVFFYVSIFLVALFSIWVSIPIDSNVFTRAQKVGSLAAATYRNTFHMFTKFLFYGLLALLVNVFEVGFITAAVSLLLLITADHIFLSRYLGRPHRTNG